MERLAPQAKLAGIRRRALALARPLLAAGLLAGSLGLCPGCAAARANEKPGYVREIEERCRHLEREFRGGNLLGVVDLYADDAQILDAGGSRAGGRQEIDEYWSGIESPLDWRIELRRVVGSETLAYAIGRSLRASATPAGTHELATEFLWLWTRDAGGAWKIALDASWTK